MKDTSRKNKTLKSYRRKVRQALAQVRAAYNIDGIFTESDFYRICEAENIHLCNTEDFRPVSEQLTSIQGVRFGTSSGKIFIYLKSFFDGDFDLFTAMHELGHHFLKHEGSVNLMTYSVDCPKETEANYFAELATSGGAE